MMGHLLFKPQPNVNLQCNAYPFLKSSLSVPRISLLPRSTSVENTMTLFSLKVILRSSFSKRNFKDGVLSSLDRMLMNWLKIKDPGNFKFSYISVTKIKQRLRDQKMEK